MSDETITMSHSGIADELKHDSDIMWKLFWGIVAGLITFAIYKFIAKRSLKPTKVTSKGKMKSNLQRKATEDILSSVYSSSRFQAARMRRTSVLVKTLGINNPTKDFEKIADNFHTVEEVSNALKTAGVDSSNLIFGKYSKSERSFSMFVF